MKESRERRREGRKNRREELRQRQKGRDTGSSQADWLAGQLT